MQLCNYAITFYFLVQQIAISVTVYNMKFIIDNLIYYIFLHIFQATAKLKMPAFLSSEAKNADYLGK